MGETTKPKTTKKKISVVAETTKATEPKIGIQEIQKPFDTMIEYIMSYKESHTAAYMNLLESNAKWKQRATELEQELAAYQEGSKRQEGTMERIQELTEANAILAKQVESFETTNGILAKQVEDTVDIANRQIEELEADLAKRDLELKTAQEDLANFESQSKELDRLRESIQQLTEELKTEKETHRALQKDFETQLRNKTLIGGMDRENKKLRDDITVLQLQMDGLRVQRDAAKEETANWRKRAEEAESQLEKNKTGEDNVEIFEFEYRGTTYYCDDADIVYSDENGKNRIGYLMNGTQMCFDKDPK